MASGTFLQVMRGEDRGKAWELREGQVYVIGRSRRCTVRLGDAAVSAMHARVECNQGVWAINDLQSSHGTRVNEQRILAGKPLFDRDRIQVGRTRLEFREYEQLDPADLALIDRDIQLPE